MACNKDSLVGYLRDFSGQRPLDAIICPFAGPNGAGIGVEVFALVFVAGVGMALAIRTQHPAPLIVAGILSAGLFATALPAGATMIFALILFAGVVGAGLYLYSKLQRTI